MNRNYKIFLTFFIFLIFIFATISINNFRIDASSDTLVAQGDKDFEFFNYYQNIFPTKSNLIIAIESKNKIDKKILDEINKLTKKISDLPEVFSVFNINKAPILFLNKTNLIDLSNDNYETILNTSFNIDEVLNEFTKSPIYRNQIINIDKNITSIIIFLKPNIKLQDLKDNKSKYIEDKIYYKKKNEIDNDRELLIKKLRSIIDEGNKDYNYYLGGIEMISNDVISFIKSDIIIFSLLVIILVIIILFVIFRDIRWVITILLSSMFAVYTMIGLCGFLNFEITAVSANFISLMFILSISMNIHILNNYLIADNNNLAQTLRIMFWPCFYTFLTTVVAFFSLVISDIKPIIDFGLIMIISLIIILTSAFTILPLFISFFSKANSTISYKFKILEIFFNFSNKYKKSILTVNLLFFFIAIFGIINLNVENSFIKYFKKNTEIYQGMKLIDSELGGTTPLDIVLKFNDNEVNVSDITNDDIDDELEFDDDIFSDELFQDESNIWFEDSKIDTIKKVHNYLEERKEIGKVTSIYSLIDLANKINKGELSTFELSVLYNKIPEQYKNDLVYPYLNIEKNMVKISARVKDSEEIKRSKLIDDLKKFTNNSLDNINEVKINGLLVLYNNMLSSLFSSQIKSLGFVILAIFVMFLILFKSFKLSIVGIIPNIFASTFILGLIGLLNIPLDIMTITIAAISIGIAVDNTIHYLFRYRLSIVEKLDYKLSIKNSHLTVGKAVLITSVAISLGFLTLCFSNFVPTIIFGLFTCLAMIFAMIGVLITLPVLLHYLR